MDDKLHKFLIMFTCLFYGILIGLVYKSILIGILSCVIMIVLGILMYCYLNGKKKKGKRCE